MSSPRRRTPRQRHPELERDFVRTPALGYEEVEDSGLVRCLAHGFPSPLVRWHFHDEYELHLITETSGRAFVGDWIGPFEPGHLVLCGPRLPHNWVSFDVPEGVSPERDYVILFHHDPIARAAEQIPEMRELLQLLDRARHGIEFFGMAQQARAHWEAVRCARGMRRFAAFCGLLADLAGCRDYRLLSAVQLQGAPGQGQADPVNAVVDRIMARVSEPLSVAGVAAELGMSESRFSRFFRRATGNSFTDFVSRVRINNACHLLLQTDHYIADICLQVGFNNVANFNRRFLEVKGMTPSQFRRQAESRFARPVKAL